MLFRLLVVNFGFIDFYYPVGPFTGTFCLVGTMDGSLVPWIGYVLYDWGRGVHFLCFYSPLRYILNDWFVFKIPLTAHQITLEMADSFLCTKFESGKSESFVECGSNHS